MVEESLDNNSESEEEVSDDSDIYCSDENVTKTIDSVAPDELWDDSVGLERLHLDIDTEPFLKQERKQCSTPVLNILKEGEAI